MGLPFIPILGALGGLCCGVLYALVMVLVWPITQIMVNQSTIELPYSVIHLCDGSSHASMVNEVTFNFKAWLHSDFQASHVTLSTTPVDGTSSKVPVGTAMFPKMSLAPGQNSLEFTTSIEFVDQALFKEQFLNPMFVEGKKMKLFLEYKGLTLREMGLFPCPGLHMRKALVCQAKKNPTAVKQISAETCNPTKVSEKASDEASELNQMTDLIQMAGRRLQANAYAMECVAGIEDSNEPSIAV